MNKPKLLDLFSGAGEAAKGYMDAGFYVIGVDIAPQTHYIGDEFYQDDALLVLDILLVGGIWHGYRLQDFTVIHASPECKSYTICNFSPKEKYQQLIAPVRERLNRTGLPWIIENVVGAKHHMNAGVLLCGSMFGLRTTRHRLFESNIPMPLLLPPCDHRNAPIAVYGHSVWDSSLVGTPRKDGRRRPDSVSIEQGRQAMGIVWMNINELSEAIPPAYTQFLGEHVLAYVESEGVA
jgi:hypothetical protein